jgi:hypothetical protein
MSVDVAFYTKSVVVQSRTANVERKKHFVIKYGPPASGKGTIEPLVCRLLGVDRYVDEFRLLQRKSRVSRPPSYSLGRFWGGF